MKSLVLLRGLPGAGKSTLAELISNFNIAADDYPGLYDGGFHPELLGVAHQMCQDVVMKWMEDGIEKIVVHNTLTTVPEMDPYYELAEKYDYVVHSVIVENRHSGVSVHNVPETAIQRMEERFVIQLSMD